MVTRAEFETIAEEVGVAVKGKKNPFASKGGHMFAFLSPDDGLCLRFSEPRRAELAEGWGQGPVMSYGSVMRGYVALPEAAMGEAARYLGEAEEYVASLPPK
ncbi:MAG: hypothetical protein AAGF13_01595 [Pseudomonadota bacterium]